MTIKAPRKWFTLLAAFMVNGQIWGNLYSYSILYSYLQDRTPEHELHASLIGSLTFGVTMAGSLVMPPLMHRIPLRWLYVGTAVLYALGPLMCAFVTDIRFWYFTFTIPVGLGGAGMFILAYVSASRCYPTRLCATCTLISLGVGGFSMVLPVLYQFLLTTLGLQYYMLSVSGYLFVLLVFTPGFPRQTTAVPKQDETPTVACSMQVGSVASIAVIAEGLPEFSIKISVCNRNFIVWLFANILHVTFNNLAYVHLTSYAKNLIDHPSATPKYFMITVGIGAIISKVIYAVLIEKYSFPIYLGMQITIVIFSLSLSLLGLLEYFTDDTAILVGLYFATFLLGFGEGPIWSLAYPATYETCKPYTDPIMYCIFCGVISLPYCLGGPLGTVLYQLSRSYALVYFVAALSYLTAVNIIWTSTLTNYTLIRRGGRSRDYYDIIEVENSTSEKPEQLREDIELDE